MYLIERRYLSEKPPQKPKSTTLNAESPLMEGFLGYSSISMKTGID